MIEVRRARKSDAPALVRIHADMGAYYAELAPELFHDPDLQGFELVLEDEIGDDLLALQLVAEVDGEVVGSLDARLLLPPAGAQFAFTRDLFAPRLRIEYLATAAAHRRHRRRHRAGRGRRGVGARAGCDGRRAHDLPGQPARLPVLDRARRLHAALDQPPQGAPASSEAAR